MFCHKCGMENSEQVNHCISCGEQLNVSLLKENIVDQNVNNEQVRSPLVWSILITVFGFFTCAVPVSLVLGIIGIVFSSRIDEKQRRGDYIGAKSDAKTATILNWVALGFLVLTAVIIGVFIFLAVINTSDVNIHRI